jgi:hypothetical protein
MAISTMEALFNSSGATGTPFDLARIYFFFPVS